ncbi:MAG: UDP-N-acetylglucosamine 2-epimerase (non-hydrolyzing) [Taibaiella sp.]|nr:UDP-N-acetylglucosamine 2-epimerase (non-hydrolyzing) [Taibaiella sp.]
MKIITIVGARPQFVKAAVLSREFKKHTGIQEVIVHTGQHFDSNMSAVFFDEMQIPQPQYSLDINGMGHGAMTGAMLAQIEQIIINERPDAVMVYGDTNSTLAGALAAAKMHVPVIHVEAGLRSFNMHMPEEINRILTDRISSLLFCPTDAAIENLEKEGFKDFTANYYKVGDVMEDAAIFYSGESARRAKVIQELKLETKPFALCTIHRAENTDDLNNLRSIVSALNEINRTLSIVLPLHPRTKKIFEVNNISPEFTVIDPVGYFDMIELLKKCTLVLTDSGGLQKEAFFFGKYCITLREQTEWIELVENGYNYIAGTDDKKIVRLAAKLAGREFPDKKNLYGNGAAASNICKIINEQFNR